jgi:hypothetical protein
MKRYWLFIYQKYYPSGGMLDYFKSFDSKEEALYLIEGNIQKPSLKLENEWSNLPLGSSLDGVIFHIFDSEERIIVDGGEIRRNVNQHGEPYDDSQPEWFIDREDFSADELVEVHKRLK